VLRKTIAISLLFIFLYANTEIGQLLKFPNLIHHFLEHHKHKDEHAISFLDFVKSHYNDIQKHSDTDEHDEHQNLPFKTLTAHVSIVFVVLNQMHFSFTKPHFFSYKSNIPFVKNCYTSDVFASIWLPPKLS
jgi:hypothetical protein